MNPLCVCVCVCRLQLYCLLRHAGGSIIDQLEPKNSRITGQISSSIFLLSVFSPPLHALLRSEHARFTTTHGRWMNEAARELGHVAS